MNQKETLQNVQGSVILKETDTKTNRSDICLILELLKENKNKLFHQYLFGKKSRKELVKGKGRVNNNFAVVSVKIQLMFTSDSK